MKEIATILRGEPQQLAEWIRQWDWRRWLLCLAIIVAGAGCYGAAIGWWRSPQQALYTAIKCPLVMLLTALGNALINGMLAPLLGVNIPFRQSIAAILMSFVITAAILGAFSPILAFVIWNAPPLAAHASAVGEIYACILLGNVLLIAFAGFTANARLFQLLQRFSNNSATARRVLFAWLAGNLFMGSQLSWILRPFVGAPDLPIQFLRTTAFKGNFYEAIFHLFLSITAHN
jgi:hypothetical protein